MNKGNQNLVVKRTATGLGLFALQPIPVRKRIIEYVGPLVSTEEANNNLGKYFFEINTKWSINGSSRTNTARYINHSCRPNAIAFISGRRIWIWSKKTIQAGAEITLDYGKAYFDTFIKLKGCKCEKCINKSTNNGPCNT
ncbi:MAG: SET domain-containing protein [Pyrinomonadaceae bacterium]|nr:SET domain-containing protein [Pyrinomonadaceae bacterium]